MKALPRMSASERGGRSESLFNEEFTVSSWMPEPLTNTPIRSMPPVSVPETISAFLVRYISWRYFPHSTYARCAALAALKGKCSTRC